MLHIISRSYAGENKKGRPDYYSKRLSLISLIQAFQQLKPGTAELIFMNDGPIPDNRLELMKASGEVVMRSRLGMRGSLKAILELPIVRSWPKDDLVWFAEDDYLYQPHAFVDLLAATEAFPEAAYFGLYALIGMREPNGTAFEDVHRKPRGWSDSEVTLINGHPWRRALSTTSTFGVRVQALVEDHAMMMRAMYTGGAYDHTTCLMYQGFTPYPMKSLVQTLLNSETSGGFARRAAICGVRMGINLYSLMRILKPSRHRILMAPEPALITHLETKHMAVGTDWEKVASQCSVAPAGIGRMELQKVPA
ncbi:hypothetical protein [Acidisoma sp.]|uniref:hypothetical protein n=1 Tax=Acidisoma sp. TaxID=1872115 RepID=UPI003B00EDD5